MQTQTEILKTLKERFNKNMSRHTGMDWSAISKKLEANPEKLKVLNRMELSGGEPDVVSYDVKKDEYTFIDCSQESPIGRRSLCYDRAALDSRKANKPINSAFDLATEIGVTMLTEEQYKHFHKIVQFDNKTSSWVLTPDDIRKLGGAIFCDYRFGRVFTYHNGAESYYAARGFRGLLLV
ncbi:MAG: DUF4256 domain-containing protein [Bacteroidia bacterium]|nr:DUF4256 domain-containing protein [Bacteroidia bacterium]